MSTLTDTASETPRPRMNAATLLQMLHEERMAFAQRSRAGGGYSVDLKRSTASGSLGVVGIDLHGEQRDDQTAEEFITEQRELFDSLCAAYPMPDGYVRAK